MITIKQSFTGYPDGKRRRFAAGEVPTDVAAEYEDLLVAKGHATRPTTTVPVANESPETTTSAARLPRSAS